MTDTIYKRVYLHRDDVRWFEETYGGASFTWLFSKLLERFRDAHELNASPDDLMIQAGKEVKEEIEDES